MTKWVLWSVSKDYRESWCAICGEKVCPYIWFSWNMDNPLKKGDSIGDVSVEVCEKHAHLIDKGWRRKLDG